MSDNKFSERATYYILHSQTEFSPIVQWQICFGFIENIWANVLILIILWEEINFPRLPEIVIFTFLKRLNPIQNYKIQIDKFNSAKLVCHLPKISGHWYFNLHLRFMLYIAVKITKLKSSSLSNIFKQFILEGRHWENWKLGLSCEKWNFPEVSNSTPLCKLIPRPGMSCPPRCP